MTSASAPGKAILFGEHAVVYGRPAIAVPIHELRATATVQPNGDGLVIEAPDLGRRYRPDLSAADDPLALAVRLALQRVDAELDQSLVVRVTSQLPVGRGLGSSAAVAAAIVRAVARHFGHELPPAEVSALVYRTEVLQHGTPSGIDNTVIAYEQPVYFVRDRTMERFAVGRPLHLILADTGIATPTRETVADVRAGWQQDRERFERLFAAIGAVVERAREAIARGHHEEVGRLMDENHTYLRELGVSCPQLDHLVTAAREAGALGAKLSGGGRGGNMIALAAPERVDEIAQALRNAGAVAVITTVVR
jgi:mevalonate kinase